MFKGREFKGDWELRLDTSSDLSGFGGVGAGIQTSYALDYIRTDTGVYMAVGQSIDSTLGPLGNAYLYVPALGADITIPAPTSGDLELRFTLQNLRVYAENTGVWSIACDGAVWTVNGSTQFAFGAFSIMSGTVLRPASVPLIGIGPVMQATAGYQQSYVDGQIPPGGYDPLEPASASVTATGGYRTVIGGVPVALPVLVDPLPPLEAGGLTPDVGGVGGSDTWSGSCSASASASWGRFSASASVTNAILAIGPNAPREMIRMEEGQGAQVLRFGMPAFDAKRSTVYDDSPSFNEAPLAEANDVQSQMPARAIYLGIAGDLPGLVDEAITDETSCLYSVGGVQKTWSTEGPTKVLNGAVSSLGFVGDYSAVNVASYLREGYPSSEQRTLGVLANTRTNPFWSYALYQQSAAFTTLDLNERAQQHLAAPSLSGDADFGRLTNVVAEGLDQDGFTGLWEQTAFGPGCPCPWGVGGAGVEAQVPVVPPSLTMDARTDGRWTYAGDGSMGATGAGSVTGGKVVGDPGNTTFDLALGSYSVWPYQTSHLADRLTITLAGSSNVSRLEAFLIGVDGKAAKIGEATDAQPMRLPRGVNSLWWTSAGQTFRGDGYTLVAPGTKDASLAVANDAETATAMPFVGFRAGARIRFVATPIDPDQAVEWAYPVLYTGVRPPNALPIRPDGASLAILQTQGTAIRYGIETHYDPLLDAVVREGIVVNPFDRRREAGDWLVWRRLWMEARAWDDGLDAEIAGIYELGVEYTQRKHLWRDPVDLSRVTHSWMVQGQTSPVGVFVSSFRSIPPVAAFPTRKRLKASNWQSTGGWGAWSYTLCQTQQWHLTSPGAGKGLYRDDVDVLTYPSGGVEGWRSGYHRLVVDGTEGYDWEIRSPAVLAKVKPYRGYVWDGYQVLQRNYGGVSLLSREPGDLWKAEVLTDGLTVKVARIAGPRGGWSTTAVVSTDPDDSDPSLSWDPQTNRAHLRWSRGTEPYYAYSDSDGRRWSDPVPLSLIPGGRFVRRRYDVQGNGLETAIVDDGGEGAGKLVAVYRGRGDLQWSAPYDLMYHPDSGGGNVRVGGEPDSPAGYDQYPGQGFDGRWCFAVVRPGDDASTDWFSAETKPTRLKDAS